MKAERRMACLMVEAAVQQSTNRKLNIAELGPRIETPYFSRGQ
jgi:hypothetical protein